MPGPYGDAGRGQSGRGRAGAGGTPLDNAVGYGCWHVARKLVEHGAQVDALRQAAALGMLSRVQELIADSPPPGQEEITEAFWQACHGGQRPAARPSPAGSRDRP